jgi:site-specific recombinase XerD
VNAAIVGYYQSTAFQEMSAGSKKQYRSILERFRSMHGDKRLRLLEQRHIVKLLAELRPHARANWLYALRGLLNFAVVEGFIEENPAVAIKLRVAKTKGHCSWTENEVAQYEARHPIGTKARLALALPLYTALRNQIFSGWGPSTFATAFCMSRSKRRAAPCSYQSGPSYRRSSPIHHATI